MTTLTRPLIVSFAAVLLVGQINSHASGIVHDAEYYILEAQNGEKWSAEDRQLEAKLAELKAKVQAGIDQADAGELTDLDIGAVIDKAKQAKSRRSRKASA